MSIVALSPVAPEPLSPMITSVTPTLDPDTSAAVTTTPLNLESHSTEVDPSPGPGTSHNGPHLGQDNSRRSNKPPPLHTGADWKVVLHLPEIETWLRVTSDRVTQLTHSVGQDSDNRHVDVHLVQLKDICEDISDHVEQIHALLETEFSLKLLSYSVNIIVDIRTVQLLWHQLRVSVLVLKERLLQGLQDSNGNYTRQTDILQAFGQEQHQTRLDALMDVDDCGQLTIRCSQNYFSLDCGITAFELSDYSPSEETEARRTELDCKDPTKDQDQGPNSQLGSVESEGLCLSNHDLHSSLPELAPPDDLDNHNRSLSLLPTVQGGLSNQNESVKRPLQGVSHSTEVSPTQPSLPKRAALFSDRGARVDHSLGGLGEISPLPGLKFQAELSRSTPSLMDAPDRSKFWLELDSVYPENVSQSYESLQVMNGRNLQRNCVSSKQEGCSEGRVHRALADQRSPSGARLTASTTLPLQDAVSRDEIAKQMDRTQKKTHAHSEGDSESSLPSPMREHLLSSDVEASGEESDPPVPPGKAAVWIVKRQGQKLGAEVSSKSSPDREHWYGSEEFLALPSQLRKTEMLALKLESLAQSIPLRPGESTQEGLQDVDDWDLTELNPEWDNVSSFGESGDDVPSPVPPLLPYRRNPVSRFSPTSSSDNAPSSDESIETGLLSDLQSEEDEGRRSADHRFELTAPPVIGGAASLVQNLLEDIHTQDKDPEIWKKIECFVHQLDGFILWLQEALDSTENWTQPRQDLDSLRVYLDTHLSFKLNVDGHSALKESVMEEGRALLAVIPSHQSGLKDILHMVSSQWDQLQRQIRRQHGWMLRTVRCIQARLLYTSQSHELFTPLGDSSTNQQARCSTDGLKAEVVSGPCETQRAALEQMAVKLSSLHYPSSTSRRQCTPPARSNSSSQRNQSVNMNSLLVGRGGVPVGNPRSALSPVTNSLLEQLDARIKELKAWLRDTELLIFNSCLRQDKDTSEQLQSFKSLCAEVRARRRGMASILKLCQKLLQQSQSGPMAEVGPEAEQHREALQLLSINLERRWEAIVMQALQWQNRLKRELGEQQVPGNFLELGLVDLRQISPVPADPVAPGPDDSWEWDETDMTITEPQPQEVIEPDLTHNLPTEPNLSSDGVLFDGNQPDAIQSRAPASQCSETVAQPSVTSQTLPPNGTQVYQVYSLYNVELYRQPQFPYTSSSLHKTKSDKQKQQLLLKSLSKDSSFSSIESLPDLLGGLISNSRGGDRSAGNREGDTEREGGRLSGQSADSRRSECESGIVSDTGDVETTLNSEAQGAEEDQVEEERRNESRKDDTDVVLPKDNGSKYKQRMKTGDNKKGKGWRKDENTSQGRRNKEEEKRKKHRRGGGEAVEILINGRGTLTLTLRWDPDPRPLLPHIDSDQFRIDFDSQANHQALSQASSLESLLAQAPLASPLTSQKTTPIAQPLSRRTLDLLKRLENIQSPLSMKMTRSVSDLTLRSSSPRRSQLPASPSLGGQHSPLSGVSSSLRKGPPSLINESSATASLTELSSTEDSSLGSEDFVTLKNQRHAFLDVGMAANANSSSYRKGCHGKSRGGHGMDEADATSLSMVVNVSCTSACTDEDEDDSDLLSSSTLTLTEEELGVRDGEEGEEERLSGVSSGNEDDEDDEDMEGSYVLGLEYMKRELQNWIRSPRTSLSSSSSKTEAGLRDELQCGTHVSPNFTSPSSQIKEQQNCFLTRPAAKLLETNMNSNIMKRDEKERDKDEENKRNATRSYICQFVDDMENGNVEQSCLRVKDEDVELLREESSVFTKKGESLRELYVFSKTGEPVMDVGDSAKQLSSTPSSELTFRSKRASSLVGQLRGELPCHSPSLPSPPSLSPVEDCRSHDALHSGGSAVGGRKAITIQEKFKFSSFVTEETRREVRDKQSSLPPKKRHSSSCCNHLRPPPSVHSHSVDGGKKENVHDFVMQIIDLTSLARKSKENQPEEPNRTETSSSNPDQAPASLAQIRDKVLEHSHRPLHLRKGDFYSYLSLSSHDSDCGEVGQFSEDKSSSPAPYGVPAAQGLGSPSPQPFPHSTPPSGAALLSKRSPSGLDSKNNLRALNLTPADSYTNGSRAEEPASPTLSLPPSPDIRDEETLFAACTEEVYLGPPLCYSMALSKKPRRYLQRETLEHLSSPDLGSGQRATLSYSPHSKPDDSLQYLSQEGPHSGHSLSHVPPPKTEEYVLDGSQGHLYFQGFAPTTEETHGSTSPCYSSFSTSSPSTSSPASLRGPGSKPSDDKPPSAPGTEEEKRGEAPNLLCDVAGGEVAVAASVSAQQEERSRNEGPPYLNPRARVAPIDSSAAECLADTKTLESNMGAVMTKISVCSSATNPSKEPAATATRINPKINCLAMREADREERERRGEADARRVTEEEKGRRGRGASQQEPKAAAVKQVSSQSAVSHAPRTAPSRSQTSRLPVLAAGTSRIHV
ncbi:hypothetical protein Q5P01_021012 [Channa striata]|uniref:A kinase (PRKA) anchor protein 6 n=1 Tax=Channa striata TaxID=64152 RepID=A0AA88LYQ0_CHASR|nr:hypothetical protein Q5P01_021012 [Channa striata]